MPAPYEYWHLFLKDKSDKEVAKELGVAVETVEKYRTQKPIYSLDGLDEFVIQKRKEEEFLSNIFKEVQTDPRWELYDEMFLLTAICRVLEEAKIEFTKYELSTACKYAYNPSIHDPYKKTILFRLAAETPGWPGSGVTRE